MAQFLKGHIFLLWAMSLSQRDHYKPRAYPRFFSGGDHDPTPGYASAINPTN